ncbi:MAG: hypothetical protein H8E78_09680, partial [Proteobacteria bacterium]|nr:hypothetical protein [Pseudomonadota bacterium]
AQHGTERRFGASAIERGLLTPDQVEEVLEIQPESTMPLGQVLATLGYVDPETLARKLELYFAQNSSAASSPSLTSTAANSSENSDGDC